MITALTPAGPITGTDHELASSRPATSSPSRRQALRAQVAPRSPRSSAAAPPDRPAGRAERQPRPRGDLPGAKPSEAAQTSDRPLDHVDADRLGGQGGAERGEDQRQAGRRVGRDQAVGEAVQAGELAPRRGVDLLAGEQRDESSGGCRAGSSSATTRPWRRTTMRSASRNIWSMSWLASRIVVP